MTTTPTETAPDTNPSLAEVAEIIVTALNLEMSPAEIEPDGDGLTRSERFDTATPARRR